MSTATMTPPTVARKVIDPRSPKGGKPIERQVYRFRLRAGDHIDIDVKTGEERRYFPGDVIESFTDLVDEYDSVEIKDEQGRVLRKEAMNRKFERIFEFGESQAQQPPAPRGMSLTLAILNSKSLQGLKEIAAEEEIELHGADKKEDVLKIIADHFRVKQ